MHLDPQDHLSAIYSVPTAYLVASFLSLVLPLVSWATLRKEHQASVHVWCASGLLTGAGLFAVGLRPALPELLPFNTGFALSLLGCTLHLQAVRMESGSRDRLLQVLGLALGGIALKESLYQGLPDSPAHFLLTYFLLAGVFALIGRSSARLSRTEDSASMRWLSGFNIAASLMFGLRGLAGVVGLTHPDTMLDGPFGIVTTTVVILLTVVNHVSLVGLYLERSKRKAAQLLLQQERARATAELQTELAAIDRQRSLGELAAGLAHELGQPITSILMDSSSLQRELQQLHPPQAPARDIARDISAHAQRASGIVAAIRNFIKPDSPVLDRVPLVDVLEQVQAILQPMLHPQDVHLRMQLPDEPPVVQGDRIQLSQVLLNLLRNSLQARRPGQRLHVDVRLTRRGGDVVLEIEDDGVGMSDEQIARYGTPFVSTKDDGLGIGVALSRRILEHHGGQMSVERPLSGRGLLTRVSLPAAP